MKGCTDIRLWTQEILGLAQDLMGAAHTSCINLVLSLPLIITHKAFRQSTRASLDSFSYIDLRE